MSTTDKRVFDLFRRDNKPLDFVPKIIVDEKKLKQSRHP